MGEHHCTDCTIVSRGWWWGGSGFDGPQVTSCLRVCQHLWLENSVVPGLKPDVRQRLPFPKWLSLSYWGQDGIPSFLSRSPECQADMAVFPQGCMLPLPIIATLATQGQEEHVLVGKITKGANLQAGCLQRSRLPPTCHLRHHHQ